MRICPIPETTSIDLTAIKFKKYRQIVRMSQEMV